MVDIPDPAQPPRAGKARRVGAWLALLLAVLEVVVPPLLDVERGPVGLVALKLFGS